MNNQNYIFFKRRWYFLEICLERSRSKSRWVLNDLSFKGFLTSISGIRVVFDASFNYERLKEERKRSFCLNGHRVYRLRCFKTWQRSVCRIILHYIYYMTHVIQFKEKKSIKLSFLRRTVSYWLAAWLAKGIGHRC